VNSLNWFQIIISLSLQATLLTALACAIERRCNAAQVKARIWSCYYLGLLGLLAAGSMRLWLMRCSNAWVCMCGWFMPSG